MLPKKTPTKLQWYAKRIIFFFFLLTLYGLSEQFLWQELSSLIELSKSDGQFCRARLGWLCASLWLTQWGKFRLLSLSSSLSQSQAYYHGGDKTLRERAEVTRTSWSPVLEQTHFHFFNILLAMASHKTSPVSRNGNTNSTLQSHIARGLWRIGTFSEISLPPTLTYILMRAYIWKVHWVTHNLTKMG